MFIEAVVSSIDMDKGVCRCKELITGRTLINVRWMTPLGEGPCAPEHGEQVFIAQTRSGMWILGGMSKSSANRFNNASILDGVYDSTVDRRLTSATHGYSNLTNSLDHLPGDAVLNARGGSFVAALLGGVALLKASPMAQVIASKIGGFVKVFALNFQRFTEASSHEELNEGGRTFVRREIFDSQANTRADVPKLFEVEGDVAKGTDAGAKTEVVKLRVVQQSRGAVPFLKEEVFLDGKKVEVTQDLAQANVATVSRQNSEWKLTVVGADTSSITTIATAVTIDSGASTLVLNSDGSVTLNCQSLTVNAASGTTYTTPTLRVNGNVSVSGNVSLDSGVTLATHKHPNPEGGTVGTPIP